MTAMHPQTTSPRRKGARLKHVAGMGLLLLSLIAGTLYLKSAQIMLGAEAYLFGYPLVIMDITRANAASQFAPENSLRRVRQFPDARFKDVVRPNVDTLYTTGFIDMAQGPWVFEMAPNDQRYEVMPFMDAWTNVFATPGTRTTGTAGGRFLLAGPDWQGVPPTGMTLLHSPTQIVWLIGRTQTNGVADYPLVRRLQDKISLRTLADWQSGKVTPEPAWQAGSPKPLPPIVQMRAMDTLQFFKKLALLMVKNPPAAADGPMMAKLARIGITVGQTPRWGFTDAWAIRLGRWAADVMVARELKKPRDRVNGWLTPPAILGNYGTDYNTRAVVAMIGLGANLPADATYPSATVDSTGQVLNGNHRYRLHFNATELPPVKAFWSITAYGADDFLIHNALNRYALGDRDPLVYNPDGSLDLLIQANPTPAAQKNNWLPVKAAQPFLLNARLYWPKTEALDGTWTMPAIERLEERLK